MVKVVVVSGVVHVPDEVVDDPHLRGRATNFSRTRNYRPGEVATLSAGDAAWLVERGVVRLVT